MAHWNPVDQIQDLVNKHGGEVGIKRFLSGELVLVERNTTIVTAPAVSSQGLANGGVTYASTPNVEAFLDDQSKFLKDVFKIGLPSRRKIVTPKTRQGFGWGVLTPKGMTIERALASYADICPISRWTNNNLDDVTKSVRSTDKTRVTWFRDRVEADEEQKSKSYNDLKAIGVKGTTLLERLLLGRWFCYRVNQHLDVSNITRCDGSLYFDGDVPCVDFLRDDGRVCVSKYSPDDCHGHLRSREAVS